jgi:threonine-phosphate decarboxylase
MSIHGGNIYDASRETGLPVATLHDFSANINPLGMSPEAMRILEEHKGLVVHYPDPVCHELREALSRVHRLDPACFCIGNGSTELIHLLPPALEVRRALVLGPTFAEYARAVEIAGGSVALACGSPETGFRVSMERVTCALTRGADCVFLCNPNNPTGHLLGKGEVLELWARCLDAQGLLVVDEAFIDYCEGDSVVQEAASRPGLIVLRSFTKFFGMPGLRVGYLVAEPSLVERVRERQPPWSVNVLAQLAARASLEDTCFALESRALIAQERPQLAACLSTLCGLEPQPSSANFLFVHLANPLCADGVAARARSRGVLLRNCRSFQGLDGEWIRVAVRGRTENARLVQVLEEVLAEHGAGGSGAGHRRGV